MRLKFNCWFIYQSFTQLPKLLNRGCSKVGFSALLFSTVLTNSNAQGTWIQKSDLGYNASNVITPTSRFGAVGFSIGSKGYIGTGNDGTFKKDFWEYDPTSNTWTQKADFGGSARQHATGFSIGNKGYIGMGSNYYNYFDEEYFKDFWEYDPATNNWTQKADFGGSARSGAAAFIIGNKGYTGTGFYFDYNYYDSYYYKDFWEYDPAADTWTQKADFAGTPRSNAAAFSIGSMGYIGTGDDGTFKKDFWEYDPAGNIWMQKADFGGAARSSAVGFNINSKGYIGTGNEGYPVYGDSTDFWEYDPAADAWMQKADFGGNPVSDATGFSIDNKGYLGSGTGNSKDFWEFDADLNTWIQKSDFGSTVRSEAVGFSIGTNGYIGTGEGNNKDFWEYDPAGNTWTQKADFGGGNRSAATGFSIGTKGYIGTGYGNNYEKDFWEYDPALNTWTQKADFGGSARYEATGMGIGSKGYIGMGYDGTYNKDFWEYDPDGNSWTQKADFGGIARSAAVGFSIGSKGYVGTGCCWFKDFWEYDPADNSWTQKADFGGSVRYNAVGFSISSKGYIGTGYSLGILDQIHYKDFWEYDPAVNTWTTKADFGGGYRSNATGFSIGSKGYIGTGYATYGSYDEDSYYYKDFWEYTTDSVVLNYVAPGILANLFEVHPNPVQNELMITMATPASEVTVRVYDLQGKMIDLPATTESKQVRINTTALLNGFYTFQITNNKTGRSEVRKFVKQE